MDLAACVEFAPAAADRLVLVPLPGPGWAIVILGLAILASEFEPARRVLEFVRDQVRSWTAWIARQS